MWSFVLFYSYPSDLFIWQGRSYFHCACSWGSKIATRLMFSVLCLTKRQFKSKNSSNEHQISQSSWGILRWCRSAASLEQQDDWGIFKAYSQIALVLPIMEVNRLHFYLQRVFSFVALNRSIEVSVINLYIYLGVQ